MYIRLQSAVDDELVSFRLGVPQFQAVAISVLLLGLRGSGSMSKPASRLWRLTFRDRDLVSVMSDVDTQGLL